MQVMNDGKVRATVAAFRQHVPKPQPSDIAELIAVLKAYVEAQPPSRRRAAPGPVLCEGESQAPHVSSAVTTEERAGPGAPRQHVHTAVAARINGRRGRPSPSRPVPRLT